MHIFLRYIILSVVNQYLYITIMIHITRMLDNAALTNDVTLCIIENMYKLNCLVLAMVNACTCVLLHSFLQTESKQV